MGRLLEEYHQDVPKCPSTWLLLLGSTLFKERAPSITSGTVTFEPGESQKTVGIVIIQDERWDSLDR